MIVEEIMTKNPISTEVNISIAEVLETMNEMDIRHLPVVDNGILVGLVSDRDVRTFTLPMLVRFNNPDKATTRLQEPIANIMQTGVQTVSLLTELSEVVQLMIDHKFGAIPVVEELDGRLVGIVSYIDVLRAAEEYF